MFINTGSWNWLMHNWQHHQNKLGIHDTAFLSLIKFLKLYSILNHTRMVWSGKLRKGVNWNSLSVISFIAIPFNMICICFIVCYAGWNIRNTGPDAVPFWYRLSFSGKSARGGTWVFLGWVCAAQDSKLAPRSKTKFP